MPVTSKTTSSSSSSPLAWLTSAVCQITVKPAPNTISVLGRNLLELMWVEAVATVHLLAWRRWLTKQTVWRRHNYMPCITYMPQQHVGDGAMNYVVPVYAVFGAVARQTTKCVMQVQNVKVVIFHNLYITPWLQWLITLELYSVSTN